jgi:hypothetical protein
MYQNMWQSIFQGTLPAGTKPVHTPALCVTASTAEKVNINITWLLHKMFLASMILKLLHTTPLHPRQKKI